MSERNDTPAEALAAVIPKLTVALDALNTDTDREGNWQEASVLVAEAVSRVDQIAAVLADRDMTWTTLGETLAVGDRAEVLTPRLAAAVMAVRVVIVGERLDVALMDHLAELLQAAEETLGTPLRTGGSPIGQVLFAAPRPQVAAVDLLQRARLTVRTLTGGS